MVDFDHSTPHHCLTQVSRVRKQFVFEVSHRLTSANHVDIPVDRIRQNMAFSITRIWVASPLADVEDALSHSLWAVVACERRRVELRSCFSSDGK